jgi:hypothetical protein
MAKAKTKLPEKKPFRGGCMHCPGSEDILQMDTVLYQGFGGYYVRKNGEIHYWPKSDLKWEEFKTLSDIELEAATDPNHKWEVVLDNPLGGATWERHADKQWHLTDTNMGFA